MLTEYFRQFKILNYAHWSAFELYEQAVVKSRSAAKAVTLAAKHVYVQIFCHAANAEGLI